MCGNRWIQLWNGTETLGSDKAWDAISRKLYLRPAWILGAGDSARQNNVAVLAVKMDAMIKAELGMQLKESVFWTDSTSVLKHVNNENRRFHIFIANRVATTGASSEPEQWRYVGTKENPADDVSRGMKLSEFLKGRRWLEGPQYLRKAKERQSQTVLDISLDVGDKEVRRVAAANAVNVNNPAPTVELISWRLKRAVAWYLKLKSCLKEKCKNKSVTTFKQCKPELFGCLMYLQAAI